MSKWLIVAASVALLLSACGKESAEQSSASGAKSTETSSTSKESNSSTKTSSTTSEVNKVIIKSEEKQLGGDSFTDLVDESQLYDLNYSIKVEENTTYIYFLKDDELYVSICKDGKWIKKDKKIDLKFDPNSDTVYTSGNRALEITKEINEPAKYILHTFDNDGENVKTEQIASSDYTPSINPSTVVNTSKGDALLIPDNNELILLNSEKKKYTFKDTESIYNNGFIFVDLPQHEYYSFQIDSSEINAQKVNIKNGEPAYDNDGQEKIWDVGTAQGFLGEANSKEFYFFETENGVSSVSLYDKNKLTTSGNHANLSVLAEKDNWHSNVDGKNLYMYELISYKHKPSLHIAKLTYSSNSAE
ncbi:hypothetical protein [Priestia megaterium]|uniref:Lipoprotein n=1 Tax=Priestia megaterium TaxID=1404 RepID=A0A6M6E7D7_PRIMG|nr:hypothetical protein [Priestia megaterium]QJX80438.1 hypothetical protein FDZ14_30590 [Priestia megaterium]